MTIAELQREIASKKRIDKLQAQEKASYHYILADLIGRSVARIYSSSAKMPEIVEAYPTLFESATIKEEKQAKKDELSALRFKLFADSYNEKFKQKGEQKVE